MIRRTTSWRCETAGAKELWRRRTSTTLKTIASSPASSSSQHFAVIARISFGEFHCQIMILNWDSPLKDSKDFWKAKEKIKAELVLENFCSVQGFYFKLLSTQTSSNFLPGFRQSLFLKGIKILKAQTMVRWFWRDLRFNFLVSPWHCCHFDQNQLQKPIQNAPSTILNVLTINQAFKGLRFHPLKIKSVPENIS